MFIASSSQRRSILLAGSMLSFYSITCSSTSISTGRYLSQRRAFSRRRLVKSHALPKCHFVGCRESAKRERMFLGQGLRLGAGFYRAKIHIDRHPDRVRQPIFLTSSDEKDSRCHQSCGFCCCHFPGHFISRRRFAVCANLCWDLFVSVQAS